MVDDLRHASRAAALHCRARGSELERCRAKQCPLCPEADTYGYPAKRNRLIRQAFARGMNTAPEKPRGHWLGWAGTCDHCKA